MVHTLVAFFDNTKQLHCKLLEEFQLNTEVLTTACISVQIQRDEQRVRKDHISMASPVTLVSVTSITMGFTSLVRTAVGM